MTLSAVPIDRQQTEHVSDAGRFVLHVLTHC
jgi:hypothetical protein